MNYLVIVGVAGMLLWAIVGITYLSRRDHLTFHGFIEDLLTNFRRL